MKNILVLLLLLYPVTAFAESSWIQLNDNRHSTVNISGVNLITRNCDVTIFDSGWIYFASNPEFRAFYDSKTACEGDYLRLQGALKQNEYKRCITHGGGTACNELRK